MKQNLTLAALGMSLLFNVFVLIGFMQARSQPERTPSMPANPPPAKEMNVERVVNELKLDDQQAKAFRELRMEQQKQNFVLDGSIALVRENLAAELHKENPDLEVMRGLVDQEAEMYRQRRQMGAEMFARFTELLTPEQRQAFAKRFGPPHRQPGPPPAVLRRFDVNGNGRLDPDEQQAAQREFETRRRELWNRPLLRPPGWRQFDANHDGVLDDSERAAMQETRRPR